MDLGKSFSYVFEDPNWVLKVLIGGALVFFSWLILPAFILLGYAAQTTRNVMDGQPQPLPEWSNIGEYLVDGFKLFVVYLVYAIPIIIIVGLAMLPLIATSAARGDSPSGSSLALFFVASYCVAPLYALLLGLIMPAIVGEYASTNSIAAALRIQDIWPLFQRNIGDFLIVFIMAIVANIIGYLGIIACFIGVIFTSFYAQLIWAHLIGQVYVKARGGGALPVVRGQ